MVCLWYQELLGYHFTIVHIINKMMVNVYAITRHFGHLISHHIAIAALLSSRNHAKSNHTYAITKFSDLGNVNITETDNPYSNPPSFLTRNVLHLLYQDITTHSDTASSLEPSSSLYTTTLTIKMCPSPNLCVILPLHESVTPNTAVAALYIPQSLKIRCLCINEVVGSYTNW